MTAAPGACWANKPLIGVNQMRGQDVMTVWPNEATSADWSLSG